MTNWKYIVAHKVPFLGKLLYKKPEAYWNFVYGDGRKSNDETESQRVLTKILVDKIKSLGGKKILEIGCGYGRIFNYFDRKEYELNGIEQNDKWADYAKSTANITIGDIRKGLPFPDNTFDVVYTYHVLMHIKPEDITFIFREMMRVSKSHIVVLEGIESDFHMFTHDYRHISDSGLASSETIKYGKKTYFFGYWTKRV